MAEPRRAGTTTANRLDQPRVPRRLRLPRLSGETFGHFAEMFARFMGTAQFLAYMTVFVLLWILVNVVGLYGFRWDPYPFILLNLFFSTQASYAAPLILLAQNRQADRDRLTMDEDRRRAAMQKADTEYLSREIASLRIALGEVATRDFIRSELLRLVEELDEAGQRRQKLERKEQKQNRKVQERRERRSQAVAGDGPHPPEASAGDPEADRSDRLEMVEFGSHGAKTDAKPLDEPYDELDDDVTAPPPDSSGDHSPRASRG